jgi:predicted transcriptional regulator
MEENPEVIEGPDAPSQRAMEVRRSLLQIKMDILRVVAEGNGKPTQIMYKANLSWALLKTQLELFRLSGLLSVETYGSRKKYELTEKGANMLEAYRKLEVGMTSPEVTG